MSLKLQVGVSKKVGLPAYGSLGASCQLEIELDRSLFPDDMERFEEQVKQCYCACRQAVEGELARRLNPDPGSSADSLQNGSDIEVNGHSNGRNGCQASQKQLDYIEQLAGHIHGLGVRRLEALAHKMFAKPLSGLSTLEASGLIDVLKDVKAGKIDLNTALQGTAA